VGTSRPARTRSVEKLSALSNAVTE
jgi:hypothetical protein